MRRPGGDPPTGPALLSAIAAVLTCCASPAPEAPATYKAIEPQLALALEARGPGLARAVLVTARIEAPGRLPVTVVGERPSGRDGDDALVRVSVRVTDFPGTSPQSLGRGFDRVVPFGLDGTATAAAPLERSFLLDLDPPGEVLARRVVATARLYPVDVFDPEGRAGSRPLEFPVAVAESLARPPRGSLASQLRAGLAEEIFLAAAATPAASRDLAVDQLVLALDGLPPEGREAAFAALLYLTGETHGRSEYRWLEWWRARRGGTAGAR